MMTYFDCSWQSILFTGALLIPVYAVLYPIALRLKSKDPRSRGSNWGLYLYPYIVTLLYLYGYSAVACMEKSPAAYEEQCMECILYYMMWYLPVIVILNILTQMYMKNAKQQSV